MEPPLITYVQNPPIADLYRAFINGFSDYMIRFDMNETQFEETFLVRDQNQPSRSIVAYADGCPIAVMLSGVAHLDTGWVTRCGGLAVAPDYRHYGIANELMRRFDEHALGTRLLEVIQGNEPALALYERLGYKKVREIMYFQSVPTKTNATFEPESITELFDTYYPSATARPIWQADVRTTQQQTELVRVIEDGMTGALLFCGNSLLDVFGRDEDAEWLLRAAAAFAPVKVTLTSDRPVLLEAARRLGFVQDVIAQFELVKSGGNEP